MEAVVDLMEQMLMEEVDQAVVEHDLLPLLTQEHRDQHTLEAVVEQVVVD